MDYPSVTMTIYALVDPRDGLTRYIGRTSQPVEKRLAHHINDPHHNSAKFAWIQGLLEEGLQPILETLEQVPFHGSYERELWWISYFSIELDMPLFNKSGMKYPK